MDDLVNKQGVIARPLPDAVVESIAQGDREKVLAEAVGKDALTKKVHDSYMAYKAKYDAWSKYSETAYHNTVQS